MKELDNDRRFRRLMIDAATHDDELWSIYDQSLRAPDDIELDREAYLAATVAEYYDLDPEAMQSVIDARNAEEQEPHG